MMALIFLKQIQDHLHSKACIFSSRIIKMKECGPSVTNPEKLACLSYSC